MDPTIGQDARGDRGAPVPPPLAELSPPFRSRGWLLGVVALAEIPVALTAAAIFLLYFRATPGRVGCFWIGVSLWWTAFGARVASEAPFWRQGLAPTAVERFSWIDLPLRRAAYESARDGLGPRARRWRRVADVVYALGAVAFALWYFGFR